MCTPGKVQSCASAMRSRTSSGSRASSGSAPDGQIARLPTASTAASWRSRSASVSARHSTASRGSTAYRFASPVGPASARQRPAGDTCARRSTCAASAVLPCACAQRANARTAGSAAGAASSTGSPRTGALASVPDRSMLRRAASSGRCASRRSRYSGPPALGPVPDRPSPPNGCTPTTAPTMLRLTYALPAFTCVATRTTVSSMRVCTPSVRP